MLTEAEAEECISVEFNPGGEESGKRNQEKKAGTVRLVGMCVVWPPGCRCSGHGKHASTAPCPPALPAVRVGFYTGGDKSGSKKSSSGGSGGSSSSEVWTQDVLNLGVSPARLVAAARRRFEAAGGLVLERTPLSGVWVHPDGVSLQLGDGSSGSSSGSGLSRQQLNARLLLDCMGHASPIVQQVRWGQKPDGVCLVVGSCARGFDAAANTTGDVIFTTSHSQPPAPAGSAASTAGAGAAAEQGVFNTQFFWEAFPAGSGPRDRTTYLFTYMDAQVGSVFVFGFCGLFGFPAGVVKPVCLAASICSLACCSCPALAARCLLISPTPYPPTLLCSPTAPRWRL